MSIDGLLLLDKPQGVTSLDLVREVKAKLSIRKAGHVGTLDPFATGLLPVALNEGTKLIPFLPEDPKEYDAALKVGEETRTDDFTGEVLRKEPWIGLSLDHVHAAFQSFRGRIQQVPPLFSAVKFRGKPLYRLARKGIEVEREARTVVIHNLKIQKVELPVIHFTVSCSPGTYIRALARDIGRRLGCGAHLLSLRRTRSGPFSIDRALSVEQWRGITQVKEVLPFLIPLKEALVNLPEVIGDEYLIHKVRHGQGLLVRDLLPHRSLIPMERGQRVRMASPRDGLVAILESTLKAEELDYADPHETALRPLRVFHASRPLSGQGERGFGGKYPISMEGGNS